MADDIQLYEKIGLEGFQAGMAWITILRKRERFRRAFDGSDFRQVAQYGEADIERLMRGPGIVRNSGEDRVHRQQWRAVPVSWWLKPARWRTVVIGRSNPLSDKRPAVVDLKLIGRQTRRRRRR